jgi:hypothetical protein
MLKKLTVLGTMLICSVLCLGSLEAQARGQRPAAEPLLAEEAEFNQMMAHRARTRVTVQDCTIGYKGPGMGYYLKKGIRHFYILNQQPGLLRSLESKGRTVCVQGRLLKGVTPYYDYYFIVIDCIDGRSYQALPGRRG